MIRRRSMPRWRVYQKSQADQAPATGAENIRSRLEGIEHQVAGIHGHLDGIIEGVFGPRVQEVGQSNPVPGTPQYRHIMDNIDFRLREIERGLEYLSARL